MTIVDGEARDTAEHLAAEARVGPAAVAAIVECDLPWWDLEEEPPVTKGLGVLGSTDNLGVTGRLFGPELEGPHGVESRLRVVNAEDL